MSNLIKSYCFNVDREGKKVIDSDTRALQFVPEIFQPRESENNTSGEFIEGMNVIHIDKIIEEEEKQLGEELKQKSDEILEAAREEAARILENAKQEADIYRLHVCEEAKQQGYQEGLVKANEEVSKQKQQLEEVRQQLEDNYQKQIEELEPNFVDIVVLLIEKITGILVEDRKDVILHLIKQSFKNITRSKEVMIKVSSEDVQFVELEKERLRGVVGEECRLDIIEDALLQKNQCVIEVDNKILDCSLDVQLKGLIEDLKLLAKM